MTKSALIAMSAMLAMLLAGCGRPQTPYITIEGESLGTFLQISIPATHPQSEIEEMILEVDSLAKASMSIFHPESLLSKINRNEISTADEHIVRNIELAQQFSKLSGGAYDITIKPLTDAWGFGRDKASTSINIDSLLQFVGHDKLSLEGREIIKQDPRVQIDLNSIAKGYTVDLVAERLEAFGFDSYMVCIGGEIRCKGHNSRGSRWSIGIETPYDGNMSGDSFEKIVHLEDCAVATSGNYRRFYLTDDGRKVAHTIDPRTGYSIISDLLSATVVAPTCAEADAAATMFMSIGDTTKAIALAEQCAEERGWRYYFIFADGDDYHIECSEEFR